VLEEVRRHLGGSVVRVRSVTHAGQTGGAQRTADDAYEGENDSPSERCAVGARAVVLGERAR
jgi:hypothetical protein